MLASRPETQLERERRIMLFMPRNMHFGPSNATSIDLCVHDLVKASRYRQSTTVVCQENETLFSDLDIVRFSNEVAASSRRKAHFAGQLATEKAADLIVVQQHLPTAWTLARKLNAPVILHTHNFSKNIPRRGFIDSMRRRLRLRAYRGTRRHHLRQSCS